MRSIRKAKEPAARAQVRWIMWCTVIGCVVLIPGYVIPIVIGWSPFFPHPIMTLCVSLIPFTLAIAILRYRLFDIEIVVNRTLVYGTLSVLLFSCYLLLVRVLTVLVQVVLQRPNDSLVVFIATLSIALGFFPRRTCVPR